MNSQDLKYNESLDFWWDVTVKTSGQKLTFFLPFYEENLINIQRQSKLDSFPPRSALLWGIDAVSTKISAMIDLVR